VRFQQPIHIFAVSFTLTITALLTAYFTSSIVTMCRQMSPSAMLPGQEKFMTESIRLNLFVKEGAYKDAY